MQHPTSAPAIERRWLVWLAAAAAALCAAMAIPLVLGRVFVADDLGAFHLPLRAFYSQQLQAGQAFDWLPALFNGFYLTGEGQVGTYHPLHLLLYRFLPLTVAFDLELLLSYPLMLLGCYCLLCRWLGRRDAALVGAVAFAFSGFNLLHFVHPNAVAVVAHWPWFLWALDRALVTRATDAPPDGADRRTVSAWAFAVVSLLLGSEILIGYPQYVWLGSLVAAPYAFVCVWLGLGAAPRWRQLGFLLLSGTAGVLLGGVQLIPSLDALFHSTRQSADAAFAGSGSLHPLNLLQTVAPYLFATRVVGQNTHELGLYFGAVPLLLCVWLLTQRQLWRNHRPWIVAALWVSGIALVLAVGEHGFGPWWHRLPLVGKFRFPCRSIVWIYAAASLLTAIAWQRLTEARAADRRAATGPLWAVSLASVLVAVAGTLVWPQFVSSWPLIATGPFLFVLAALMLASALRGSRLATAALILLMTLDLGAYGLSYAVLTHTDRLDQYSHAQSVPPNSDRPVVAQPTSTPADGLQVGNQILLAGFRRADGYAGLVPARKLDLGDPIALRIAGAGFRAQQGAGGAFGQIDWIAVPDPLPPVRLATRAIVDTAEAPLAAALEPGTVLVVPKPGTPVSTSELLDPPSRTEPLDLTPGNPGTIGELLEQPGRFTLSTHTTGRQLLVVTTSYHDGWQATVDGMPVPVLRVNRDFLGLVVEEGDHRVGLDFRPFSLRFGRILSTLGLGLWCAQLAIAAWLGLRGTAQRVPRANRALATADSSLT
ncbi:MAG TPA: YfhO family protein [Pirellulales bacterium]|nr:YfhO family protein [Pirellulales bacterium]